MKCQVLSLGPVQEMWEVGCSVGFCSAHCVVVCLSFYLAYSLSSHYSVPLKSALHSLLLFQTLTVFSLGSSAGGRKAFF